MRVISLRENPEYVQDVIAYLQTCWANEITKMVYEDCILNSLSSSSKLPQWYLLYKENIIVGCAGLITNDFISRMDLYPWLCALYIEKEYIGKNYASILIEYVKKDAIGLGYSDLYLCTDHIGYYEKYGFNYIADGYHPWGKTSRVYHAKL